MLRIGVFQYNIYWENISRNQQKIEQLLTELDSKPDLLILPEMYSTGFTMSPTSFDTEQLIEQITWQNNISNHFSVACMGSAIIPVANGKFANRMMFSAPKSKTQLYDKRHLFFEEKQSQLYIAGEEKKVFDYKEVQICPQICYDLRFPVWARNTSAYHLLVYSANWPAVRQDVWNTLLKARAIENQCYVVGVNRVGVDGNNIEYIGGSRVISPKGEIVLDLGDKEQYAEFEMPLQDLLHFRSKFPVLKDADDFRLM